jgi:hypothetical protein
VDIINVVSVTAPAQVKHWLEDNDDETQNGLYWRQAIDVRNNELSVSLPQLLYHAPEALRPTDNVCAAQGVKTVCNCNNPENPDKTLIGCTSDSCKVWLHEDCVKHDALMRTYERLGTDRPHLTAVSAVKKEEEADSKRPLSPKEPPVADSAHPSIDVKPDADAKVEKEEAKQESKDEVFVGKSEGKDAQEEKKKPAVPEAKMEESPARPTQSLTIPTAGGHAGRRKSRKSQEPNGISAASKPYKGLFEATVQKDLSPPMVEITDLRSNVEGGDKIWLEPIDCLVCGARVK